MKAFVKNNNKSNTISLQDVPIPEMDEHDIRIKLHAIGVGIHDEYFHPPEIVTPYVIGIEGAGMIESIGKKVTEYTIGQRIMFINAMNPKGGTWAEYSVVPTSALIVPIPKELTFIEAAALPVAGNTILKAFHALDATAGDVIFIAGSSGAIGTLAIQIAVKRGYTVIASASQKNHAYMKSLGATKTVDYHDATWQQQIKEWFPNGVDGVIAIQPNTASESETVIKNAGTIVTVSGEQFIPKRNIVVKQIPHTVDIQKELTDLAEQVASGKIILHIESYAFINCLEALEKVKTRHTRGKLVVTLQNE